jgi:uncharacterized membrane protein YgdD (TMEM256/DUF423 family)
MKGGVELFAVVGACLVGLPLGCAAGSTPTQTDTEAPAPVPAPAEPPAASKPQLRTPAEFCAAEAKAACSDAVVSACGSSGKSGCEAASAKSCLDAIPQGTTYQPDKAPACLAAVTATYSSNLITAAALASLDPVCGTDLFAGPGAARAPCLTDYDCDSTKGLECVLPNPPPDDDMGQCFVPQLVAPGGDCSGQGTICEMGTYCDPTGLTCITAAQLGEGCNAPYYPCAPGLQCPGSGSPFATCVAAVVDGAACNASTECSSGLCDKATDQAGGTCASSITLSSLDSMCQEFE